MANVFRLRTQTYTYVDALRIWESGQISLCAEVLEGTRGTNSTLLLARCLVRLGKPRAAITVLRELLVEDLALAHAAQAMVVLCFAMRLAGDIDDAAFLEQSAVAAAQKLDNQALLVELKFGRAVVAFRAGDDALVSIMVREVFAPEALAVSEAPLGDYPFSLSYGRARFAELSAFVHQRTGDVGEQMKAFDAALAAFDESAVIDDFYQSALLANYAEYGVGLGIREVIEAIAPRVARFTPSADLNANLLRTYGALAEAHAIDGDLMGALRTLRQGSELVAADHLQLRAMVERARALRDNGEVTSAREELESAVRYCATVDWPSVDHEDASQLLPLAALVASYDAPEAERIVVRYESLTEGRRNTQLRIEDTRLRAEAAYARASIARAVFDVQRALDHLGDAFELFRGVAYDARAAQVAFEIVELTGDTMFVEVVQAWIDRHPSSPLGRKIAAFELTLLGFRDACNDFDTNRDAECLQRLTSQFTPAAALLRARVLLRLHCFDAALEAVRDSPSSRIAERLEGEIIELMVRMRTDRSDDLEPRFEELRLRCVDAGYPAMGAEVGYLASASAIEAHDEVRARRHALHVLAIDASARSKPSMYRYDVSFWHARCAENLARFASARADTSEAAHRYRDAFAHARRSRIVSHRLQAQLVTGYSGSLVAVGADDLELAFVDGLLENVTWGDGLRALEIETYLNLADACWVMGSYASMMRYLRAGNERSRDTLSRLRMSVARIRLLREIGDTAGAEHELALTLEILHVWFASPDRDSVAVLLVVVEECLALSDLSNARRLFAQFEAGVRDQPSALGVFRRAVVAAALARADGDPDGARARYESALRLARSTTVNLGVYLVEAALALVELGGDPSPIQYARSSARIDPRSSAARALASYGAARPDDQGEVRDTHAAIRLELGRPR